MLGGKGKRFLPGVPGLVAVPELWCDVRGAEGVHVVLCPSALAPLGKGNYGPVRRCAGHASHDMC